MRPNQNNKNRQRGSRNGGRKHVNPLSRNFESTGPDVKVRGNAAHIAEKYLQLARDAQSSGDSVMAENYLQHAEHYFRIVSSAQQVLNGQRPDGDEYFDDDMPEMNSRFSSPQPPQQQYVAAEGEEGGESGEQPRQQQGEQRPPRQDGQPEGDRQPRGDRRDRNRNRDRFRPEGEGQQPQPVQAAAEQAQPQPQPQSETAEAAPAPVEQVADAAEGETRKRRPRRRRPAGGDDLANADQPDVGELPAFLTAGTNAAE